LLPELLRVLEKKGEINVTDEQRELLSKVSSGIVDRLLSPVRKEIFGRRRYTIKPRRSERAKIYHGKIDANKSN
jgi:hypothetical protein